MTHVQTLSTEQLISYVERVGAKIPDIGIVPDKWVAYRRELERRGYQYWFFTGKVIEKQSQVREDLLKYKIGK